MTGGRTALDYTGVIWGMNMNWCKVIVNKAIVIRLLLSRLFSVRRYWPREWRAAHRPHWRRHSRTIATPTDRGSWSDFFNMTSAHLQIDGKAVTLAKRVALSGSRYSGGGVTLKIGGAGTELRHAKRTTTACELL
jgi:hypothetical protein